MKVIQNKEKAHAVEIIQNGKPNNNIYYLKHFTTIDGYDKEIDDPKVEKNFPEKYSNPFEYKNQTK